MFGHVAASGPGCCTRTWLAVSLTAKRQQHRKGSPIVAAGGRGSSSSSRDEGEVSPLPPPAAMAALPQLSERAVMISCAAPSARADVHTAASSSRSSSSYRGEKEAVGKWAEQYRTQLNVASSSSGGGGDEASEEFLLPIMTLSKVKLPTESILLQIFEPRYRLFFKLVNQSASRRFGVVLADKHRGVMESVGALCELTHFVTVPEQRHLFINARVIGRFSTQRILNDKPFVAVLAAEHSDRWPVELADQLQAAAQEQRVWDTMQEIKELAAKLFLRGEKLGNDIFSLEARRWSPDAAARAGVPTAAGADPALMGMVQLAGLLGDKQTMAERTTEYVCSDALRSMSEAERRERFSFALARTLDFGPERLQQLMYSQDTGERLQAVEVHMLEGRAYMAARSTLRDMF